MDLSEHFTLEEFTQSQTADRLGIDNTPPTYLFPKLHRTAQGMEQVRKLLGKPITITSGYRCAELNKAVGSKNTSQHMLGEACDFICPTYGSPDQIIRAVIAADVEFDQIIKEFADRPGRGWVHISFKDPRENRKVALEIDGNGTRQFA